MTHSPGDAAPRAVTFVVPGDVDTPTGGNVWDRRVRDGLRGAGHDVVWCPLPGAWPEPDAAAGGLAALLDGLDDGASVVLDGLVGCGAADVVVPRARRLRLVVVVHLPLADETGLDDATARRRHDAEGRVLASAAVVVVTSGWAARRIAGRTGAAVVVVAVPGTDPAPLREPTASPSEVPGPPAAPGGGNLLCLAPVTPRKGQRLLVDALASLPRPHPWRLRLVGPERAVAEVAAVRSRVATAGLGARVELAGPAEGAVLERHWAWADLLVVPSLVETFGMVVTEALACGVPALVTTGSALPDTLGQVDGGPPGLLVPPGDRAALAGALARWLAEPCLRRQLADRARTRSAELVRWPQTVAAVASALAAPDTTPDGAVSAGAEP